MVYVDPMFRWPNNKGIGRQITKWDWATACHMVADTEEELLAFAMVIGLQPGWIQRRKDGTVHFDLIAKKRKLAVANGAKEISAYDLVCFVRYQREQLKKEKVA